MREEDKTTPAARRHETLLAHREWVRALARSLTSRAEDADDVEQATWAAALASAPEDARSLRGWLVTVARNAARKLRRTDRRQRERAERSGARPPARSAAELAEEADVHARVVAAVVALDEPYREAILLRYFEGLPVRDVAARAGAPLETVRARLRRARATLRERLEAELGPERPWRLALAVLAVPDVPRAAPVSIAAVTAGGALVTVKTVVAALAVALVAALVAWGTWGRDAAGPPAPTPPAVASSAGGQVAAAPAPRERPRARPAEETGAAPAAAPGASAAETSGRPEAQPSIAERLAVVLEDGFSMTGDSGPAAFGRLADMSHCPVVLTKAAEATAVRMFGNSSVSCSDGATCRQVLDALTGCSNLVPVLQHDRIVITNAGEKIDAATVFVEPPHPAPHPLLVFRGRVTDVLGAPVAGAEIVQHPDEARVLTTTDATGAFELRRRDPLGQIGARAPGQVPTPLVLLGADLAAPHVLDLALRGAAGTVRVRVSTADGPLPKAVVHVGFDDIRQVPIDGGARTATDVPRRARTDDAGVALLAGIPPGTTRVAVTFPRHAPQSRDVLVVAGETVETSVVLVKQGPLAGRLAAEKVTCRFADADPRTVLAFLSQVHGVNLVLMPDVAESAASRTVSLDCRDEPLTSALRTICDQLGDVTFTIDEASNVVAIRRRAK